MYIEGMIGYMILALPFYIVCRIVWIKRKKIVVSISREVWLGLFVVYVLGLASQTILPRWGFSFHFPNRFSINLIPFHTLYQYVFVSNANVSNWGSISILNLFGNVFLFSPIGMAVPFLWNRWNSAGKIFWLGLGITCFIETTQLFIGRSTDIDDVILNTLGVMIGFYLFRFVSGKLRVKNEEIYS
jgi:glycopeptide antibiotics resistance protein